jgi:hypothetical protein
MTRFLLLSDSCWFVDVGRSLTRGQVCRLQLLLALASADIFGSDSHGTRDHNYCFRYETSLFVASYNSQGYGGGISIVFLYPPKFIRNLSYVFLIQTIVNNFYIIILSMYYKPCNSSSKTC